MQPLLPSLLNNWSRAGVVAHCRLTTMCYSKQIHVYLFVYLFCYLEETVQFVLSRFVVSSINQIFYFLGAGTRVE